jgi:hypothetical protein
MRVKKTILIYLYVRMIRAGVEERSCEATISGQSLESAVSDHGAPGVMCSVGVSFGRYGRRNR